MRHLAAIAALAILAGCAYPNSKVEQGTAKGLLTFRGVPADARIVLDGQDIGTVSTYSGDNALSVSPGTHRVVITSSGAPLIDKKYYVGAGSNVVIQND